MNTGFSLIIPTYNQNYFIRRVILSLYKQTYQYWELIIVHEATGSEHPNGHITMYNGEKWISDFVQSDMYGGTAYREDKNYTILRWNP